jgi:glycosyltransferase involved in cell wall biosynthesis
VTGSGSDVSVVIPSRNEADRIADTIRALKRLAEVAEIIVVDDGSDDGTGKVARSAGADLVLRHDVCRGKGAALSLGLEQATGSIIAFVDADLGDSAGEIGRVLEPVAEGVCDMAIASPGPAQRGGFGLVVRTARQGIKRLCGVDMRSPLSGQRAMRRELLAAIGALEEGFGIDVALTIDALRAGARVVEIPVEIAHRELGKTIRGFAHRARQWLDVRRALRARRMGPE